MIELSVVIPIRNEAPSLEAAASRADRDADARGAAVRDHRASTTAARTTSFDDPRAAAGGRPAPARDPLPPELRPDRRVRRRLRSRARPDDRHLRRRPAERSARHSGDGRARSSSGHDIVCGWRKDRKDAFLSRRLPSMIANSLISVVTGVHLHDYGCSLKVFRAEVVKPLRLYGEMHRFLPAIASEQGVSIAEVVVNHRPRQHGQSKYGIGRTIRVMLDLLTVKFLLSYSTRPLQIFGLIGVVHGAARHADQRLARLLAAASARQSLSQPAAAAARHPADLHRRPAGDAGAAGRTAGADLSRVAEQADVRHSRDPRVAVGGCPTVRDVSIRFEGQRHLARSSPVPSPAVCPRAVRARVRQHADAANAGRRSGNHLPAASHRAIGRRRDASRHLPSGHCRRRDDAGRHAVRAGEPRRFPDRLDRGHLHGD